MSDKNINDVNPKNKNKIPPLMPKQHPFKFDTTASTETTDSNIITHQPPVIALTPY